MNTVLCVVMKHRFEWVKVPTYGVNVLTNEKVRHFEKADQF